LKGFFITGTDTGVGKTFVTCAFARAATSRGKKVFAFKPIETGCPMVDGRLFGADQELLAQAAGNWQRGSHRGVYRFALAAAPLVAATAESETIDLEWVADVFKKGSSEADLVLVEGAGGWRVPITETVDMGGLAKRLGLPVIVVARAGLGTINHSLLTIEAVEHEGLTLHAVVLNPLPTDEPGLAASNAEEIRRKWPGTVLIGSDHDILAT
jgi:dethiobiotin synthetase